MAANTLYRWKSVDIERVASKAQLRTQSASVIAHWDIKPALDPKSDSCSEDSNSISNSNGSVQGNVEVYNRSNLWLNLTLLLISLTVSLCYIMFPVLNANGSTNYFAYYMGKAPFWAAFGIGAFVEQMEACLPGSSDLLYVYAYILAFIAPPITHLIAYYAYLPLTTIPSFNMFAVATSQITIMVLYGIWQYKDTHPTATESDARVTVFDIITDNSVDDEQNNDMKEIMYATTTNPLLTKPPISTNTHNSTPGEQKNNSVCKNWLYAIPQFVKSHRLLPRYFTINTDPQKKPRIIAKNRLVHFVLTCVYYLEWFLLSYLLIVS